MLKDKLASLINAGMDGVNISLDTLENEKYACLTGFDCLDKVVEALDAACESGIKVKINTVVLKENIDECTKIAELAKDRPIDVRFIELMPIGEGKNYSSISCGEVFERLKKVYPNIYSETSDRLTGPAVYYGIDGFKWKFGLPIIKGYLAAGPYVGFRVGGDKLWDIPGSVGDQLKAKSFNAGLNLGAGVELIKHLQVGFNYALGLTDDYSASKLELNGKNRGWSITAAILF